MSITIVVLTLVILAVVMGMILIRKPRPAQFSDLVFRPGKYDDFVMPMYPPKEKGDTWISNIWGRYAEMHFDNGFGVSVVCHYDSYGHFNGLYEMALLRTPKRKDGMPSLCYLLEPFFIDVLGWLTEDDVTEMMQFVQNASGLDLKDIGQRYPYRYDNE